MSKRIIVEVSPQGETKLRTEGFSGSDCQAASRSMEQALGLQESEELTAEYFHTSTKAGNTKLTQGEGQ